MVGARLRAARFFGALHRQCCPPSVLSTASARSAPPRLRVLSTVSARSIPLPTPPGRLRVLSTASARSVPPCLRVLSTASARFVPPRLSAATVS